MRRASWRILVVGIALNAAAFGQSQSGDSLGDVARANRSTKQTQEASGAGPKVITNQELPSDPPGVPEESASDPMTTVSGVKKTDQYADQRLSQRLQAQQRAGAQWKTRIEEQEARIAALQLRIDRVNASTQAAVGTASYDTPVNRYQTIQTERVARLQEVLDQQKRRLAAMQDAARRAGVGQ